MRLLTDQDVYKLITVPLAVIVFGVGLALFGATMASCPKRFTATNVIRYWLWVVSGGEPKSRTLIVTPMRGAIVKIPSTRGGPYFLSPTPSVFSYPDASRSNPMYDRDLDHNAK